MDFNHVNEVMIARSQIQNRIRALKAAASALCGEPTKIPAPIFKDTHDAIQKQLDSIESSLVFIADHMRPQ